MLAQGRVQLNRDAAGRAAHLPVQGATQHDINRPPKPSEALHEHMALLTAPAGVSHEARAPPGAPTPPTPNCVTGCVYVLFSETSLAGVSGLEPCGARQCVWPSECYARDKAQVPELLSCRQTCAEHGLDVGTEENVGEGLQEPSRVQNGCMQARVERPACSFRRGAHGKSVPSRFFDVHVASFRSAMSMLIK